MVALGREKPHPSLSIVAPFESLPWQRGPWRDKSSTLLLDGTAGSGKSRLAGEKIHGFLKKYPNAVGIALRKTRESVGKSCMMLMDNLIIGNDPDVDKLRSDFVFRYRNGSMLFFGGMADEKQAEQIRSIGPSGKVDIAWMEEGVQFTRKDYDEVSARLRGTAADWTQLIITTNPDYPLHWINKDLINGHEASRYFSSFKDNPYLPQSYIERLQRLTGIEYKRLVLGEWCQAEGVVYDNWSDENISDEAEYNPEWPVLWGVDNGYAYGEGPGTAGFHPRVVVMAQRRPDGGINIFNEYVKAGELPEATIEAVEKMGYPAPRIAYVDSSALELQARLWKRHIKTYGATHKVTQGISNMRRFICDGNGVRMLKVNKRCVNFINEVLSYRYEKVSKEGGAEPEPLKFNDHVMDATRYLLWSMVYG